MWNRKAPWIVAAAVVSAAACGGTDLANPDSGAPAEACTPGQSIACVGSGGCASNQVCDSDGRGFGPCDCPQELDATAPPACVPGQSIACVGPGGCSSSQICNATGTGYGSCVCGETIDASTACVPGQSVACTGTGGCISNQVCNDAGTGYGACGCVDEDGATPVCIPGESIACTGQGGCFSNQICNGSGTGYGPCICSDAGSVECETATDCENLLGPLPPFCTTCKNGQGCLHYDCVLGICQESFCN